MGFSLAVIVISFIVGFAMKRGGLCTYAAVTQMVNERRMERMMVFLGVGAWATLLILPLHWMLPSQISLSSVHSNLLMTVLGGAVLGFGAYLNRGCFFGTFVALVSGNLNYVATLLGLSLGVIVAHVSFSAFISEALEVSAVSEPTLGGYVWLGIMLLFAIFMTFSVRLSDNNTLRKLLGLDSLRLENVLLMILIGLCGAFLYATVSGWNYSDVLSNISLQLVGTQELGASHMAMLCTVFMLIGGITAAVKSKEFRIHKVQVSAIMGSFFGGIFMGSFSLLIPGGNDALLLSGFPSLAPHAFVGYFSMLFSMLVLVYLFRNHHKQ